MQNLKKTPSGRDRSEVFRLYFIKPSHYDDDGYVIQWARSEIPSNTLAALNGIALDCRARRVLGEHVDIEIVTLDETNARIRPARIARAIADGGGKGMVALVGVQSNQFPRAVDIARPLRAAGIQVCLGGFHPSGCLAMLPEAPDDIREAWSLGISIFSGEAEGRFDQVLRDAYRGELRELYDFLADLPNLEGVATPILPAGTVKRTVGGRASFDSGRGCPFQCSFCTIINVQGRKSRYRTADDIEHIVREHHAQGIRSFFITDDNFARNRNWEAIFDRIIALREGEGIRLKLIIQVDTLCHLIPDFVEKAGRAGVNRVFIGLENINPDNLMAAQKRQNRITEYRKMLQDWKSIGALTVCGYIVGFPADTPARVLRDIEIIKRELPLDLLEFFCLTPLPGSADHRALYDKGVAMDPDMNNYDTEHVCTDHPLMTRQEFQALYHRAWEAYYTVEHLETLMRRAVVSNMRPRRIMRLALWFYGCQSIEGIHPLQGGLFRRKYRKDRRYGMPIESPVVFYGHYAWEIVSKHARLAALAWRFRRARKRVERDPDRLAYTDLALSPPVDDELDALDIFTATETGAGAVEKVRAQQHARAAAAGAAGQVLSPGM